MCAHYFWTNFIIKGVIWYNTACKFDYREWICNRPQWHQHCKWRLARCTRSWRDTSYSSASSQCRMYNFSEKSEHTHYTRVCVCARVLRIEICHASISLSIPLVNRTISEPHLVIKSDKLDTFPLLTKRHIAVHCVCGWCREIEW